MGPLERGQPPNNGGFAQSTQFHNRSCQRTIEDFSRPPSALRIHCAHFELAKLIWSFVAGGVASRHPCPGATRCFEASLRKPYDQYRSLFDQHSSHPNHLFTDHHSHGVAGRLDPSDNPLNAHMDANPHQFCRWLDSWYFDLSYAAACFSGTRPSRR